MKTALLIGATGLIGSQLLTELLHSPYYTKVIVLTRRTLGITNTKLDEIIFDFDNPDASEISANDVFCCLGTTIKKAGSKAAFKKVDFEYPLTVATLARQNGAEKFLIVSSMGADAKSMVFYSQVKGQVEQELSSLAYPSLHIFRPSLLLGERPEPRVGEKVGEVLAAVFKPVLIGPLKKFRAIDSAKVARAMLAYAMKPDKGVFIHDSGELQNF